MAGPPASARSALAQTVSYRLKTLIGVSADIEVLDPEAIERMVLGKAVRVFDRRNPKR